MHEGPMYPKPDVYITLYCADESHKDNPWIVGTWELLRGEAGDPPYWQESIDQYLKEEFFRRKSARHDTGGKVVAVTDTGPVFLDYKNSVEDRLRSVDYQLAGDKIYLRDRLKCHRCGMSVKRVEDKFQEDLFTFFKLGFGSDLELRSYQRVIMPATERRLR